MTTQWKEGRSQDWGLRFELQNYSINPEVDSSRQMTSISRLTCTPPLFSLQLNLNIKDIRGERIGVLSQGFLRKDVGEIRPVPHPSYDIQTDCRDVFFFFFFIYIYIHIYIYIYIRKSHRYPLICWAATTGPKWYKSESAQATSFR